MAMPAPQGAPDDTAELMRSDALRLFADRAAAVEPGFALRLANAATVAAICRAVDGLPLGIELAAAWVRMLTVEQIAARLADRFMLLSSAERMALPRHRTLRAAIDWSHDLLPPAEKVLLRRLSVFASWPLEMAEDVCAGSQPGDELAGGDILNLLTGGAAWMDPFLDQHPAALPGGVLGPALIGRAQLALASDPADASQRAKAGLELCRGPGLEFWAASALNLLAEAALHAGQGDEAELRACEALAVASGSGDEINVGYCTGTRAAAAASRGDPAEALRPRRAGRP